MLSCQTQLVLNGCLDTLCLRDLEAKLSHSWSVFCNETYVGIYKLEYNLKIYICILIIFLYRYTIYPMKKKSLTIFMKLCTMKKIF